MGPKRKKGLVCTLTYTHHISISILTQERTKTSKPAHVEREKGSPCGVSSQQSHFTGISRHHSVEARVEWGLDWGGVRPTWRRCQWRGPGTSSGGRIVHLAHHVGGLGPVIRSPENQVIGQDWCRFRASGACADTEAHHLGWQRRVDGFIMAHADRSEVPLTELKTILSRISSNQLILSL